MKQAVRWDIEVDEAAGPKDAVDLVDGARQISRVMETADRIDVVEALVRVGELERGRLQDELLGPAEPLQALGIAVDQSNQFHFLDNVRVNDHTWTCAADNGNNTVDDSTVLLELNTNFPDALLSWILYTTGL